MNFTTLIPNIFYADAKEGLRLFADCMGFEIVYNDLAAEEHPFCILKKGLLKIHLIQSEEFALKDRPELRLETDDIEAAYEEVKASHPDLLHPNLKEIKMQPWGVREFALLDRSGVCVIIYQS